MEKFFPVILLCVVSVNLAIASDRQDVAVQIIKINEKTLKFDLDEDALEKILHSSKCRNNPVSIVSIAGATRKGKSFMLNFFLKYLTSSDRNNWLGNGSQPLTGFSWRGGYERDTTGILLWSEPVLVKRPNGQDVCVLLMDTQGSFDGRHTMADTAIIFAISTMTSSVQIYNLFDSIQEDDLHHLELFTEYGRLALKETSKTPFQKLMFLVRDFRFVDEYDFGLKGGQLFLDEKLEVHDGIEELSRVRRNIRSVFEKLECFLMPYPGEKVAMTKAFNGNLKDISGDFLTQLKVLVPYLFSPTNIVTKKVNGQEVTGRQLLEYFKAYIKVFTADEFPKATTIMDATAHADHQAALNSAREAYYYKMEAKFAQNLAPVTPYELSSREQQYVKEAVDMFLKKPKMGSQRLTPEYLVKLRESMNDIARHYMDTNDLKHRAVEAKRLNDEFQRQAAMLDEERRRLEKLRSQEKTDHSAATKARDRYISLIDKEFGSRFTPVDSNYLNRKHREFNELAETLYRQAGGDTSSTHFDSCRRDIKARYASEVNKNEIRKEAAEAAERTARLERERQRLERLRAQEEKNDSAAARAQERYISLMKNQFGAISTPVDPNYLNQKHQEFTKVAETLYRQAGGDTSSTPFQSFRRQIKVIYESEVNKNENRRQLAEAAERKAKLDRERQRLEQIRAQEEKNYSAASRAEERYTSLIENQFGAISSPVDPDYLRRKHLEFSASADALYWQLGGDRSGGYYDSFQKNVKDIYAYNVKQNEFRKKAAEDAERQRKLKAEIAEKEREAAEIRRQVAARRDSESSSGGGFWATVGAVVVGFFAFFG
ncbi:Atlastin-2 [Halotydeus destructor]|nr:Atlastin-2 [Halotydeus destructor]